MVIIKKPFFRWAIICFISLLALTGCPGIGDRVLPSEEAKVVMQGDNVCFLTPDVKGRQTAHIAINPRGTPYRQQKVIFDPDLTLVNDRLCIPPSFFHFPREGQFVVEYVLASKARNSDPRIVVTGIEMINGQARVIPLSPEEVVR